MSDTDRFEDNYRRRNPSEFPSERSSLEEAQALLEAALPDAISTLTSIMLHSESDKDRLQASRMVIEFGIGKAAPTPVSTQAAKSASDIIEKLRKPPKAVTTP